MVLNFGQFRPSATRFQYNWGHWVAENTVFLLIQSSVYGREFNKLPQTCFENMPEETLSVTESMRRGDIDRRREMVFFFFWDASSERGMSRKQKTQLSVCWFWLAPEDSEGKMKKIEKWGGQGWKKCTPKLHQSYLCRVGWWECEKLLSLPSLSMICLQWKFYFLSCSFCNVLFQRAHEINGLDNPNDDLCWWGSGITVNILDECRSGATSYTMWSLNTIHF